MNQDSVTVLKYSNTNTYLIEGVKGSILFDTGWAGTFSMFCAELGRNGKKLSDITYVLISHYHPDHMGIAQEIADHGSKVLAAEVQRDHLHDSDGIFAKEKKLPFTPIRDEQVRWVSEGESRKLLSELGLAGEILHTPGHSDDSISLWLDSGDLFVGDLNPLYELELHEGTQIGESWQKLLSLKPKRVFYGHAKMAILEENVGSNAGGNGESTENTEVNETFGKVGRETAADRTKTTTDRATAAKQYDLVARIMKYIDKGYSLEKIARKTGADPTLIEDVNRMYLTHTNVGVQGILDRIEIKGK